jgi:hypothetical protein
MNTALKYLFILYVLATTLFFACKENDNQTEPITLEPCNSFPCGETYENWYSGGNRVASFPEFRKGMWVNVRASAPSPDTIIFHTDSIWSRFNENGGGYYNKYTFVFANLVPVADSAGNIYPYTPGAATQYNDTTGVLSILQQAGLNGYQAWDHYVKVE